MLSSMASDATVPELLVHGLMALVFGCAVGAAIGGLVDWAEAKGGSFGLSVLYAAAFFLFIFAVLAGIVVVAHLRR